MTAKPRYDKKASARPLKDQAVRATRIQSWLAATQ
jgi:hypothetical protein